MITSTCLYSLCASYARMFSLLTSYSCGVSGPVVGGVVVARELLLVHGNLPLKL